MQLTLTSWHFRYPDQTGWALDEINLIIRPGGVTWLAGAAGSGTSTLLLALAGLAPRLTGGESRGTLHGDGAPIGPSPLQQGIAYLGPSPALQISGIADTVRDEVAVGPVNLGRPVEAIIRSIDDALQRLELTHLADRAPSHLSGGETQRVLLASMLACSPAVWLLDEPFSALDRASALHAQRLLRDVAHAGAAVVVACDDADAMLGTADRLIVLQHGRIVCDGAPAALLAGDAVIAVGAGTTDAAALARMADLPPPRPLTRDDLLHLLPHATTPSPFQSAAASPATVSGEVLRFDHVAFAYPQGSPVLRNVDLTIGGGEAVGIFGANGAGKSTLLRLAMALERPTSGKVTVLGEATTHRHPEDLAPQAGFLFQQPERQLFASTVAAECALAPRIAGWNEDRIRDAVAATLDELGLSDTARQHSYDLALPLRRLVALAAILSADPALILLDEPTAGLDAASRERVISVVRRRVAAGRTVVAITHDPLFAHEALQRGVLLAGGDVVHDGGLRDIMDDRRMLRPAALAVALALGIPPGMDRREAVARRLRS